MKSKINILGDDDIFMFEVYRTDELENAIDFLEQAAIFYNDREHPHRFKWICISLHGALYGFAVCNISGTDPVNRVFKKSNTKKDYERDLLSIWSVLKLCKNPEMLTVVNGKVLELKEHQITAIQRIVDYRNSFSHFKPSGYSILGSIEENISPILEVICFFVFESNNIFGITINQKERIKQALLSLEYKVSSD